MLSPVPEPAQRLHILLATRYTHFFYERPSMYYESENGGLPFLLGIVLGVALGAGLALIVAPQSGRRTRRHLARRVEDVTDEAVGRWDDARDELRSAVRSSRKKLDL